MTTYIRQKIVRRKGSRNRLLFLLDCGHVVTMPTCTSKKLQEGELLRCRDCEQLGEAGEAVITPFDAQEVLADPNATKEQIKEAFSKQVVIPCKH